ncbi:MAG: RNA-binding protein [Polaromonas sp.]|nr:RNA-binding protein [Polaromonas sp.]
MHQSIEHLKNCVDHSELKSQLHSICSSFGPVARLDIVIATQAGKRQGLCFLRMKDAEQESHVMHMLGAGRFGGDIVVVVDLNGPAPDHAMPLKRSSELYDQSQRYAQPSAQHLNA